jgi:BMFP domain-containing protein YqiC
MGSMSGKITPRALRTDRWSHLYRVPTSLSSFLSHIRPATNRAAPHWALGISMHSQNPFLDEFAKLTQAAMGIAQTAGEEAKTAMRAQADRLAAEFDLIRRDDFEALKAEVAALRAEVAELKAKKAPAKKSASNSVDTAE